MNKIVDNFLTTVVGANLARIRLAEGLTQEQLGLRAGITGQYVAKIEQGKRTPSLGVIEDLARAMGRDPLEMFRRPRP